MSTLYYESSFAHHGIKGQKWGVRRFQNPDGTLTKAGKVHQMNREASEERGRKIAADKTKHFGSDAAKVAGVNIGATVAKDSIWNVWRAFKDTYEDNRFPAYNETVESGVMRQAFASVGKIGMSAVHDLPDIIGAGQTIYNVYKGAKMARDIYDYHKYKKTKTS